MMDFLKQRWSLVTTAIENKDTTLLDQATEMSAPGDQKQFYDLIRATAIQENSLWTLQHLVERGVSFKYIRPSEISGSRSISTTTLEFLSTHGWDINWRGGGEANGPLDEEPFMWQVASDGDMVAWCLEHGASVIPRGQEPTQSAFSKVQRWWNRRDPNRDLPLELTHDQRRCVPILERVAKCGTVATFELLRSKGAPLSRCTLHRAVEVTTYCSDVADNPEEDTERQKKTRARHKERIAMVRHLLDVVGLDVNGDDQPPDHRYGMHGGHGKPISYIPGSLMPYNNARQLIWLLLDRGADPTPALKVANEFGECGVFVKEVEAWQAQNGLPWRRIIQ